MKAGSALVILAALTSVAGTRDELANAANTNTASTAPAKRKAPSPLPVMEVGVVAVDTKHRTITVRDIAAVPAPPGHAVEVKLPVPLTATGTKLGAVKAGETVAVTCEVKEAIGPKTGLPIVLTDCTRVTKIESKP
jgi:hypothetical protein